MAILSAAALLKQNNLRLTDARKEVLDVLQRAKIALSRREVEKELSSHIDRITTYRTLTSFKKKGLIHTVIDPDSGTIKYLFTDPDLPEHHVHFKCSACQAITCLNIDASQPDILVLPRGFQATYFSFLIEGLCNHCSVCNSGSLIVYDQDDP